MFLDNRISLEHGVHNIADFRDYALKYYLSILPTLYLNYNSFIF